MASAKAASISALRLRHLAQFRFAGNGLRKSSFHLRLFRLRHLRHCLLAWDLEGKCFVNGFIDEKGRSQIPSHSADNNQPNQATKQNQDAKSHDVNSFSSVSLII
jgi:hypothetical protein